MFTLFKTTLTWVNRFMAEICGWMLCVIMGLLLVDIISRTLGSPILGVAELAMFVMISTVYLGLANCEMIFGHVRVESLTERFGPNVRKYMNIFCYVLGLITLGVSAWAMTDAAFESYADNESMAGLVPYPLYPVKMLMMVGLWLYFFQFLVNLALIVSTPADAPGDTQRT